MPTARELLEQADALMRRNRGTANDARTPSQEPGPPTITYAPSVTPRTIQNEPISPSTVSTTLPVDPTAPPGDERWSLESSAEQDQELPSPPVEPGASTEEDEVPLLTDAVTEPIVAEVDDVPLLTDAVEEIDVTVVDEAGQGEPSYWDLTAGEASVLGSAPESITVVPESGALEEDVRQPVAAEAQTFKAENRAESFESRDPLGLDQPAPGFEAESEPGASTFAIAQPIVDRAAPNEREAERVRALAEEIGMQVLQRIDIFSETELRAQLGERIKPVVDRVSADLVAAINQHVAELVRVHIAEAIEGEMESWLKRNAE